MTHLHNVVIEQQPEAMALHYGDVMSSVWTTEDTQTNSGLFHCATRLASTVSVRPLDPSNPQPGLLDSPTCRSEPPPPPGRTCGPD